MQLLWVLPYILAGLGLFTFIEYIHHRHGGHLWWMGRRVLRSHREHHRDPLDGGATYLDKLRYRASLVLLVLPVLGAPRRVVGSLGDADRRRRRDGRARPARDRC